MATTSTPKTSTAATLTMAAPTAATSATPASVMAMRSTEVGPRLFTLNQVHAPARSVDLITAAIHEASLPVGGRALAAVASMGAVLMVAVGVVDRTQA